MSAWRPDPEAASAVARAPVGLLGGWLAAPDVPGRHRADDGGAGFEVRRQVYSAAELFGRDGPHPDDAGALFLDTETTGLAGGTGTTPFLIGLAYLDDAHLVLEQYFLRRLSGEPALLAALRARLEGAAQLVTFNGRRFDWPILAARYVLGRLRIAPPPAHLDLMSVARRLWHRPLGTYRLAVVEREALAIDRGWDIDSAQIPGLYVHYLRTGDAGPLEPVFVHNAHDVRTLVHLRRRVRRWVEYGEDPPPPVDWEGLGVLRLQVAQDAAAEDALRRALQVEDDPAVRWRIARRLARVLRRGGRYDEVAALWHHCVGGRGAWRARALLEAATAYHRARRPEHARAALEEAAALVEWLHLCGEAQAADLDAQIGRRRRALGGHRTAR
ncbi:MAG: ribonuclease H-like domain-containing protein [Armatimonadota bacterium]|nr:ribonuclease H-like domain-containing protein [Armatimonadota bacterium]MDR7532680.1 ribonuclease H-like domain-containing protein [Armatimonadota bacterium]MDR7536331.1 ribonuclease H-like domain-containing protein [Armatimonadota bacterium]